MRRTSDYRKSIINFVLIILVYAGVAIAQDQNSQRGYLQGNSYSITDIENVNLTNGNLMMKIPLATVPGRGSGSGYTVTIRYDGKLFTSKSERHDGGNPSPSGPTTYVTNTLQLGNGGWGINSSGYELKVINRLDFEVEAECVANNQYEYNRNAFVYKVEMNAPDGGVIEFRPYNAPEYFGAAYDGYYSVDQNGTDHFYSLVQIGSEGDWTVSCGYSTSQFSNTGMNYYSSDGSGIRLFVPYGLTNNHRWKMYYPNGTIVENAPLDGNGFQRITDRNGNKIVLKGATVNGLQGTKIENDVGQWAFVSNYANSINKIIQPGIGGELLETTIHWGESHYVQKKYRAGNIRDFNIPEWAKYIETGWQMNTVDKITLPIQTGGLEYNFTYYADDTPPAQSVYTIGWGELKSVTLPTGAKAEYGFSPFEVNMTAAAVLDRGVLSRTLTYDNELGPVTETTGYWHGRSSGGGVTKPDGSIYGEGGTWLSGEFWGFTTSRSNPDGSITEWIRATNLAPGVKGKATNAYIKTEFNSIRDAVGNFVLTAIKDYDYDKNGNLLEVREYDWVSYGSIPRAYGKPTGVPANAVLKRKTVNNYYNPTPIATDTMTNSSNHYSNPSSPKLHNVIKSAEVRDGNNAVKSRSEFYYDDPDTTGNLTETRVWDSTKGAVSNPLTTANAITTSATYNSYGMPLTSTDAKGVVTQITYGSVNGYTDLYPTQTVAAYGTSLARTTTVEYDFYTGLVTRATDVDNGVTSATEYDALGRPLKSIAAVGTPLEIWTRTEYDDIARRVIIRSDLETKGDGKKVAIQHYDQLGRVRLTRTLENAATEDPTNEQHGIKVETRYGYNDPTPDNPNDPQNTLGTYSITSNPFRAATAAAATNDSTMGWTLSYAVNTGRHSEVETFSGAALPAAFGGTNSNSSGKVQTDIDANSATVTDQAGKLRRSITNALGQLTRVDEPNASNQLGTVATPNQPTHYYYNTLGKMVRVNQGVQNRYFLHDSLGRLLRVRQPEQEANTALNTSGNPDNNNWTAGFTYDNNGNVLTATDAKNTTITSTYDALNRPLNRMYSDFTPPVAYTYDEAQIPFSRGKTTKISSSVSESRYTAYNAVGSLISSQQITDGQTYSSSYKYNLAGTLVEQTYPSGRVVKTTLDSNGGFSNISSRVANGPFKNYASNFEHTASGVIKHLQLGNGLWESASINSRHQVTELKMGNSPTDGSKWKVNYEYGELQTNGTVDATKNSGNIAKQTISFTGLTNPFVQAYKYDSLDRITEAKETNNGNQTWIQQLGYDQYGNRTSLSETVHGQAKPINEVTLPATDQNTNRFSNGTDYEYDAVGNLIRDVHGRQFTFNGDNKQIEVKDAQHNVVGHYLYDGAGQRIKKVTNTEYIVFVYDGLGKLIGEYSTDGPPQNPDVSYTATDPLGSPRAITNKQGEIVSRRDFMPFGEEVASDITYRTAALKYGVGDKVRQKFTGYEHDEETGLDFAEARYYYNNHGRFTAVDPLLASGKSADPQTFNRYVYVMNRPLILNDPTGLQSATASEPEEDKGPAIQINTSVCKGFFSCLGAGISNIGSSIKSGVDFFVRSIGANSSPNDSEEEAFQERKRGGVDKQVGSVVKNSLNDLGTATDAVVNNEPTGVGNLVKATVNNSLGRASDGEVLSAYGSAALNVVPAAKLKILSRIGDVPGFSKAAEAAGGSVQKSLDSLVGELAKGNLNPGIGTKKLFGEISYARARDGARVFFRQAGDTIEILAKANKKNEDKVIDLLKKTYGN